MIIVNGPVISVEFMSQNDVILKSFEGELRKRARHTIETLRDAKMRRHNFQSILLRLTGLRFEDLMTKSQLALAKNAIECALLRERKKARQKHYDYDLNRHIALHQAKLTLEKGAPEPI